MSVPVRDLASGIFVHVSDIGRAAGWYARLLGQPTPAVFPNGHIAVLAMANGTNLVLDSKGFTPRVGGDVLFMFDTADVVAAERHVRALGAPVVRAVEHAGAVSFFNFADPDGNVLMSCQRHDV